jgi:hypothetical protein
VFDILFLKRISEFQRATVRLNDGQVRYEGVHYAILPPHSKGVVSTRLSLKLRDAKKCLLTTFPGQGMFNLLQAQRFRRAPFLQELPEHGAFETKWVLISFFHIHKRKGLAFR